MSDDDKKRYCNAFRKKYDFCALECKYYFQCITWENYKESLKNRMFNRRKETKNERKKGFF